MVIRRLPQAVVNQIAAGEVVERPASVVKELVENALDAGARRVRVEIAGGGAERIVVIDDGDGFAPDDLPLAFASHATSKLADVADLDHIASLGFRGEALASIGAVSRARIQSRQRASDEGWEVRCEGGAEAPPQPCGAPAGTRIEIRDLFFNVPARRRFLKAPHAERARIQQLLAELALARLDVDFTLVGDDRELLRLPAGDSLAQRFARCFGSELAGGLLPVERRFGEVAVSGVVGEPDLARRDGRLELLFVNGRTAQERSALHAIRQAYREFLMGGRFPVYALAIALPPHAVDVNVHPRKAEVRFVDTRRIAGSLHEAVRATLRQRHGVDAVTGFRVAPELPRARSGLPQLPRSLFEPSVPSSVRSPAPAGELVREPTVPVANEAGAPALPSPTPATGGSAEPAAPPEVARRPNPFVRASGRFLQVMDLYLLLEVDDGLLVVDQHALHERVVYERLQREHAAGAVHVQRLLTPAIVEVTPIEAARLEQQREALAAEGLLVEPFGPHAVAVHGLPSALAAADPIALVRSLAADDTAPGEEAAALRHQVAERFHSMACRASVMRGDRLDDAAIAALLQQAATLEHPHNCPHGRPTVLTFSAAELERYFRRRC